MDEDDDAVVVVVVVIIAADAQTAASAGNRVICRTLSRPVFPPNHKERARGGVLMRLRWLRLRLQQARGGLLSVSRVLSSRDRLIDVDGGGDKALCLAAGRALWLRRCSTVVG